MPRPTSSLLALLSVTVPATVLLFGCGGGATGQAGGKLNVVAAEDSWGSIAAQLGGDRVQVTSVITNPAADPHDYEPSSEDARTMATAEVSIVNGIGYDEWASKLLAASPDSGRVEIDVGDVLGLEDGDNPHQWYSPSSVAAVVARITAAYEQADPGHDAYYRRRRAQFEQKGLAGYDRLIKRIRSRFAGTPVGASESIFEPLAPALGLDLKTPTGFMDAVAEGTEPTPGEKATADRQIEDHEIAVWVYNSQNATPDVQRLNEAAESAGIPITTVTETLAPEGASFQGWMSLQLHGLEGALAEARRR
jgi:zinc/manganese transport system substrate-binding protein